MDPVLQPVLDDLARWAANRGRLVDLALLEEALDLRLQHDGWGDNHWPAGSVRQLMTETYPMAGTVDPPAPDALVATLEVFWRFLRTDGRMSARSATPAELVAEARRSRGRMTSQCAVEEHVAARRALAAQQDELSRMIPASDRRLSAADFRASGLWREMGGLLQWVAEGEGGERELDDHRDLSMGQVRELWDRLDLGRWTGRYLAASFEKDPVAVFGRGGVAVASEPWHEEWQQQTDCLAVDRLWWVAVRAGLLEVADGTARVLWQEPEEAEGWVDLAMQVLHGLAEWCAYEVSLEALAHVLVLVSGPTGAARTLRELVESWVEVVRQDLLDLGIDDMSALDEAGWDLVQGMALFDDANLWSRGERVEGTALGWDFCIVLGESLDEAGLLGSPA